MSTASYLKSKRDKKRRNKIIKEGNSLLSVLPGMSFRRILSSRRVRVEEV